MVDEKRLQNEIQNCQPSSGQDLDKPSILHVLVQDQHNSIAVHWWIGSKLKTQDQFMDEQPQIWRRWEWLETKPEDEDYLEHQSSTWRQKTIYVIIWG